jgi:hypothetical protein
VLSSRCNPLSKKLHQGNKKTIHIRDGFSLGDYLSRLNVSHIGGLATHGTVASPARLPNPFGLLLMLIK